MDAQFPRGESKACGLQCVGAMTLPDGGAQLGRIEAFMVEDHVAIDRALDTSETPEGGVDLDAYARFRRGLLRHIGMEEKVLLPFAREVRGGRPLPIAAQLRADHGAIARLLVRSPTVAGIAALRELLGRHNALEEGPDGLYATCDALADDRADEVLERLRAQPEVPLAPFFDGPPHAVR